MRRAKLYYLRDLKGKAGRMKEKRAASGYERGHEGVAEPFWSGGRRGWRSSGTGATGPRRGSCARRYHGGGAPLHARASRRRRARTAYAVVAGIDEVGRGALCGPVVAGAVILGDAFDSEGLDDSKRLTRRQRERLAERIRRQARGLGARRRPSHAEIDRLNILRATHLAMRRAVEALGVRPDLAAGGRPHRARGCPRPARHRQGRRPLRLDRGRLHRGQGRRATR